MGASGKLACEHGQKRSAPAIIWRWGSLGLVDGKVFCGTAVISFSVLVTHWAASLEVLF